MEKIEKLIIELILIIMGITWFPFMTLRVLLWKWSNWLNYEYEKIRQQKEKMLTKYFK
jgi:hypothetical protein